MIDEAEKRGDLRPGMSVVEYTGGSTGSALAFVCAVKGYKFKVVSSDAFAMEKLQTMKAFGAELTILPSHGGGITQDLIVGMIDAAQLIADSEDSYFTDQFNNRDSLVGYRGIGEEILQQVDRKIDAFCGGVRPSSPEAKAVHTMSKGLGLDLSRPYWLLTFTMRLGGLMKPKQGNWHDDWLRKKGSLLVSRVQ